MAGINIADDDDQSDVFMEQMIPDEVISIASSVAVMDKVALEQMVVELKTQLLRANTQRTATRTDTASELRNQEIHDRSLAATTGVDTVIVTMDTYTLWWVSQWVDWGKSRITKPNKRAQSTAKRVQSCRCEVFAVRCGRCAAGWLSVRTVRYTVRGLFAMRCAACGLVAFAWCAVMHGMRRPMCCAGRCAANCLRCNALRAGWLHSRGADGTMLLTEGFLGWFKVRDFIKTKVFTRFKGMGGLVGGGMGGLVGGGMGGLVGGGMGGWCDGFN